MKGSAVGAMELSSRKSKEGHVLHREVGTCSPSWGFMEDPHRRLGDAWGPESQEAIYARKCPSPLEGGVTTSSSHVPLTLPLALEIRGDLGTAAWQSL